MGLTSIYNQRPSGLFQSNAISDWMIWYRTWPLQTIQLTVGLAHQFENTPTSCTSSRPREKNTASLEFTCGNAGWELQRTTSARIAQTRDKEQKHRIARVHPLERWLRTSKDDWRNNRHLWLSTLPPPRIQLEPKFKYVQLATRCANL